MNELHLYSMAIEYYLSDGKLIHSKEQSGSNRKKYPVGTELKISYGKEKPELFTLSGDHSKITILLGMIIFWAGYDGSFHICWVKSLRTLAKFI